jgi:hypothetical protein
MESWRVVCVKLGTVNHPQPHTHIIGVGTGDRADWADMRWTIPQVLEAMMEGDVFYTRSETTGRVTPQEKLKSSGIRAPLIVGWNALS